MEQNKWIKLLALTATTSNSVSGRHMRFDNNFTCETLEMSKRMNIITTILSIHSKIPDIIM